MSEALVGVSKAAVAVPMVILLLSVSGCANGDSTELACGSDEIGTPPNCVTAPPAPAAPGKTWHLVFSEEFNGNYYDRTKLTPCFDWNYGDDCTSSFNNGKETYKPEQVRVSDGSAKLVAEPLSAPEPNDSCYLGICTYKAGLLSTARPNAENGSKYLFPFTYGYVEARIKYPAVPGFFTAFWMVPADPTYQYKTEIDIAEIMGGYPKNIYQTYHYDNRNAGFQVNNELEDNGACPLWDYSKDWTRFGVDWQPDHISWYINGFKCGEFTESAWIEDGPMQIILHLMVDNDWLRDWVGIDPRRSILLDQSLANQLEVDYIRVFQQQ